MVPRAYANFLLPSRREYVSSPVNHANSTMQIDAGATFAVLPATLPLSRKPAKLRVVTRLGLRRQFVGQLAGDDLAQRNIRERRTRRRFDERAMT